MAIYYYKVSSQSNRGFAWDVQLNFDTGHRCSCPRFRLLDSRWVKPRCKHISAALWLFCDTQVHHGFRGAFSTDPNRPERLGPAIWDNVAVKLKQRQDENAQRRARNLPELPPLDPQGRPILSDSPLLADRAQSTADAMSIDL